MPEEMAMAVAFPEMMSWNIYFFIINHKVIFDYLFKSSYMPV